MRTGTLRCGYAVWKPNLWVEPNTGEIKGFDHDIMTRVGDVLGLDIEWVEETGWGVAEQGLISNRYDVLCADVCMDPRRSRSAYFSLPYTINPQLVFVREGEKKSFDELNSAEMKVAILPNTIFEDIADTIFPNAEKVNVNDFGEGTDIILSVVTKKADFSIGTYPGLNEYIKNNSGKIEILETPADYCLGSFMIPHGDNQLKHIVDNALTKLIVSGEVKNIIGQHTEINDLSWRHPQLPYQKVGN